MNKHVVNTIWTHGMQFETDNPSGKKIKIDLSPENGGENDGMHPKALMLSALAGCTGVDVVMIINKMKLETTGFRIETIGYLSGSPQTYERVELIYHFYGKVLDQAKLERSVNMSVEKYCGVLKMFEQFAKIEVKIEYHER